MAKKKTTTRKARSKTRSKTRNKTGSTTRTRARKATRKKRAARTVDSRRREQRTLAARRQASPKGKFSDLFAGAPSSLKKLAGELHALVRKHLPDAEESVFVDWRVATYDGKGEICGIQPGPDFVKLYFHQADGFDDPDRLLKGVGKNVRHVKLRPEDRLPVSALRKLLLQARKLDG